MRTLWNEISAYLCPTTAWCLTIRFVKHIRRRNITIYVSKAISLCCISVQGVVIKHFVILSSRPFPVEVFAGSYQWNMNTTELKLLCTHFVHFIRFHLVSNALPLPKRRDVMETHSMLLTVCEGNHRWIRLKDHQCWYLLFSLLFSYKSFGTKGKFSVVWDVMALTWRDVAWLWFVSTWSLRAQCHYVITNLYCVVLLDVTHIIDRHNLLTNVNIAKRLNHHLLRNQRVGNR